LFRFIDGKSCSRFWINGDIDFGRVDTAVIVFNVKGYGIATRSSEGIGWVAKRRSVSISELPGVLNSGSGIGCEVVELEGIAVDALGRVVDGELGFGREVDGNVFREGVSTSES
jgi:hypothetical protein